MPLHSFTQKNNSIIDAYQPPPAFSQTRERGRYDSMHMYEDEDDPFGVGGKRGFSIQS